MNGKLTKQEIKEQAKKQAENELIATVDQWIVDNRITKEEQVFFYKGNIYSEKDISQICSGEIKANANQRKDIANLINNWAPVRPQRFGLSFNNINFSENLDEVQEEQYFRFNFDYKYTNLSSISPLLNKFLEAATHSTQREDLLLLLSAVFKVNKQINFRKPFINIYSGAAGTGKSSLMNTLVMALGEYASNILEFDFVGFNTQSLNSKLLVYLDDLNDRVDDKKFKPLITSATLDVQIKNVNGTKMIRNTGTLVSTSNDITKFTNTDDSIDSRFVAVEFKKPENRLSPIEFSKLQNNKEVQHELINLLTTMAFQTRHKGKELYEPYRSDEIKADNVILEFMSFLEEKELLEDFNDLNLMEVAKQLDLHPVIKQTQNGLIHIYDCLLDPWHRKVKGTKLWFTKNSLSKEAGKVGYELLSTKYFGRPTKTLVAKKP